MGFADIMKNGWHPEKGAAGASSSSSSTGRSSSMVPKSFGLGKFGGLAASSSNHEAPAREPSKPVSELTDAKLFPPPPKHREFHPDAGSAAISQEYAYLYQPALERKQQEEQRHQQQQQQWRPTGQTSQYQPQGQPQYQQPGHVPGQPAYQPPAPAQPGQPTYQLPAYQQSQQTYQSPPQQAFQSPSYPLPQQTYQPPAHLTPSAQSPPLPQRGPMPSLPPRNVSTPPFQQPAYQPPQQQPAYQPPQQQQPAYRPPQQQQPAYQPPQQHQPAYQPPQQQPTYRPPQHSAATKTRSGPRTLSSRHSFNDSANVPAKPSGLISRPISTPKPPPAAMPAVAPQQPAQTQWTPPQVDLELEKKWYAMGNNPMKLLHLPAFLSGRTYASTIAIAGNTKTIMLSVRFPDLSRTKFRIEVDRYDDNNVSAQRVDFPPPGRPSASDLEAAATSFGENVAKFVEANVGRQIGDGECWTVAKESLKASGAMESCGFIHGVEIWSSNPTTGAKSGDEEMLRRGDILQFKSARFSSSGQSGRLVEEKYVGAPDHTAVIVAVHSVAPVVVTVMEQNVGGVRSVRQGSYVFSDMLEGSVVAYRPFWKEWAGELETSWP
ncbi:uncharacterized protein V1513DRAFT_437423 [Lipomyces chichibuensis]|uniref:uncharacterized protein n=1 Tax=Lipomyces chichibuensis TaxID=1546026 RepID=UPI003342EE36